MPDDERWLSAPPAAGPDRAPRRKPAAQFLFAGFGLTIVLWLAAGVELAFRYRALTREVGAMTERFLASEQALADLRTSVLLGAIDWRDALLDSGGPDRADFYLEHCAATSRCVPPASGIWSAAATRSADRTR